MRDVPEQWNNQTHRLCSLLSQPAPVPEPALIAALMCFIVCFITRSRAEPSLHHSNGTKSAKEDTGDAPVFLSLSSQPSQISARNKIINGLTPLSPTFIYTAWTQWLGCGVISDFTSEEAERLLHHSGYLRAEHMGRWQQREDLQKRLSSICCKTLFTDYFHTMILKNQGREERENIILVWLFFQTHGTNAETEGLLVRNPSADSAFPLPLSSLITPSLHTGLLQKYL